MKKLFVVSALVGIVLIGVVLGVSLWKSSPVSSQDFLQSGKNYYDQKQYAEAVVQFLNAIQRDAQNRDARYFLALTYLNQGNLNAAAQQLSALLEYFPDDVDANLRLGNIFLTGGGSDPNLFRQAAEMAQKVLAKDPQNVAALILSGNASAGLQDYGSSVELFEKAVSLDPQNTAAFVSLGTTQTLQKNYAEAEKAFLQAREVSPEDKSALISLANYYRAAGQFEQAETVLKDAVARHPSDRLVYLQLVQFYYQTQRLADAEKVLRDAQGKNPKDPAASLVLADLYVSANRFPDARKLLFEVKKTFPEDLNVAAKLALNLIQDEPERARTEIDQILKVAPTSSVGHILLGEHQFLTGQFDAAAETFEKDPAINSPYPQPNFFLGNIAIRKGLAEQALDHYKKSLQVNTGFVPARLALAELLLNQGQLASSRDEVRKILASQPAFAPGRLLKATLDRIEKNYPEAERELYALAKEQPQNALIQRQIALYHDSRGRAGEAEKSMLRALELQPESQDILSDLIRLYVKGKKIDQAIQQITGIPEEKKAAIHYELLGLVYSQAGKIEQAEMAYKKASEKDPSRSSPDFYLATHYIQSGRLDDGLAKLDEVIKKNPANASLYGAKAIIYERQGKVDEAKKNYAQSLKIDPTFDSAGNNLAYILAEEGRDLDTALNWAQMARKKQPDNPSIADTLGWVYYKLGNHVLARDQLLFAISKQPGNAVFQYHLGMIYKETRQFAEAQIAFKKALASSQSFKERNLAQAALQQIASLK